MEEDHAYGWHAEILRSGPDPEGMTKYKIVYKDKDGLVHTELHRFESFFKASETVYGWWLNRHDQYYDILAIRARREDA